MYQFVIVLVFALSSAPVVICNAQTLTTLHSFIGTDGSAPYAGLTVGADNALYGTTYSGGAGGFGTIYKITNAGVLTTVYNFAGSDGAAPYAGLVLGPDNNFYGTTYSGGTSNLGTIFSVTPAGALTTLHTFNGADGSYPLGGLSVGSDGSFYGSASTGGANSQGAIYKISSSGIFTTLYNFSGPDGSAPYATLLLAPDGNFYGTTENGGANLYYGTIFRMTPDGTLTTVYSFGFTDGASPYASLVSGIDGRIYSTASNGGANTQYGSIFGVTPGGVLSTLYSFGGVDGAAPEAALTLGSDGNFYGTSVTGGSHGPYGTVFKLTPAGALTTLYSFSRTDGLAPTAGLRLGSDGAYYGTSSSGGSAGNGTVFRLVLCPSCTTTTALTSTANPSLYGNPVTIIATISATAPSTPTGTVVFTDGGSQIGSAAVTGGSASLTTAALVPGSHSLLAAYSGDAIFQPSNGTLSQVVTQAATVTNLTPSASPSVYSQPVTFVAQVTPSSATGTIAFAADGVTIGTVTLTGGSASLVSAPLAVGTHSLNASYSGDAIFQASSSTVSQTVNQASPIVGLISSANPAAAGQNVNFTATVAGPFGGSPSGTVTFMQDGAQIGPPVALLSGQASVGITFTKSGSPSVAAAYSGDANYLPGNTSVIETVQTSVTATSLQSVYSFAGPDGSSPSGMVWGNDGYFYGTAQSGGANSAGSIFKITPNGILTTLHDFAGPDGANPFAALVLGSDGKFYGTTANGGTNNKGTVFSITPAGALTDLYNFGGADGANPYASLALGGDGNFYGTTAAGGANGSYGTLFKIDFSGNLSTIYSFSGPDGAGPKAALRLGADGNFYGSTEEGGASNVGTVFSLSSAGVLTTLHSFTGPDGSSPHASLTAGADGSYYGTTSSGGSSPLSGTVFKISPTGTFTTIYNFAGPDGANPSAALTLTGDGSFYGTTNSGGSNSNFGTVFWISSTGTLNTLYSFAGVDGANPGAPLTLGNDGAFYSVTPGGGVNGLGSVFRMVICPACTNTSLTSSATPSPYGNSITLTATVTSPSGLGAPTGSVTFTDGGSTLGSATLTGSTASLTLATLTTGQHSISASYGGDSTFQSSNGTLLQMVSPAAVVTGLVSSLNPSTFNKPVNLVATVTAPAGTATPTGTVTFSDGASSLGVVNLVGGSASISPTLATGSHAISAAYSGDANFQPGNGTVLQIVNPAAVATGVVASVSPSTYGQSVKFTATVTPAGGTTFPTGTVTFSDGSLNLGVIPMTAGAASLTTTGLSAGTHSITASYSGDANYLPSTGSVAQIVNPGATTTTMTSSVNPSVYSQPVTVTATVTSPPNTGTATGTVTFTSGATGLGTVALTGGAASLTLPVLPAATQTISGTYSGNASLQTSSGTVSQVINKAAATTNMNAAPNPGVAGQPVALTATVTGQYGGTPTGSITFYYNTTPIGSAVPVTLTGASATTSFGSSGTYPLSAAYSGDGNFLSSKSASWSEVVNPAPITTKTTVTSSGSPSFVANSVTFKATVTPNSGHIPDKEQVTFYNGSTSLGTASVTSGVATLAASGLPVGTDSITAAYPGDGTYKSSTSTAFLQVVNRNTTTTTITSALNPAGYAIAIPLTATVSSPGQTPTGTITFKNGTTAVGTGTLSGGVATLSKAGLPVGTDALTAVYSGDGVSATSTSAALNQVVTPALTSTMIASSKNPSTKGQAVTFTALVTATGIVPTGSVNFNQGSSLLGTVTLVSGKATYTTSALPSGTLTISATFSGGGNFQGSSASLSQTVH